MNPDVSLKLDQPMGQALQSFEKNSFFSYYTILLLCLVCFLEIYTYYDFKMFHRIMYLKQTVLKSKNNREKTGEQGAAKHWAELLELS